MLGRVGRGQHVQISTNLYVIQATRSPGLAITSVWGRLASGESWDMQFPCILKAKTNKFKSPKGRPGGAGTPWDMHFSCIFIEQQTNSVATFNAQLRMLVMGKDIDRFILYFIRMCEVLRYPAHRQFRPLEDSSWAS